MGGHEIAGYALSQFQRVTAPLAEPSTQAP